MQPTFTIQEVQNIISTLIEAHTHGIKTSNMAINDAISQINKYFDKKNQELVDQQKRVAEQLAKRAKESEAKNDCDPTLEVNEVLEHKKGTVDAGEFYGESVNDLLSNGKEVVKEEIKVSDTKPAVKTYK